MKKILVSLTILSALVQANGFNPQMQIYMEDLKTKVQKENPNFSGFDYKRGEMIFTTKQIGKKGKPISCVSCHTNDLTKDGENTSTGKVIKPLSPKSNSQRFTKVKDIKKWIRRNFKDVYNRVGTAQEKGDVITYIINQK